MINTDPVPDWIVRPEPGNAALTGTDVRLEPLAWDSHLFGLFECLGGSANADIWSYIAMGPFDDPDRLRSELSAAMRAELEDDRALPAAQVGDARVRVHAGSQVEGGWIRLDIASVDEGAGSGGFEE